MSDASHRTLGRFELRLLVLGLLTSLVVLALVGRLLNLTVGMRDTLRERAELQQSHTLRLDPTRGTVRDRNGRELATSVEVESVYAVPASFTGPEIERAAEQLAGCLSLPASAIASRIEGSRRFVWLERKANRSTVGCVRALGLSGVGFLGETRRFYPKRHLASHVLGYVGIDNEGMSGIEYTLEDRIRGEAGRRLVWTDARNRRAASRVEQRPVPGSAVYLTIDENLQHIVESELEDAVEESRAESGIAILMRPSTGELLAMASFPGFNPNRYVDYPSANWRNRPVTDVYEPGSTFKIITAAAALAENVTSEEERIDCGRGSIAIGSHVIHDAGSFDFLSFREVVERSSNVGMVRIGQRLGKKRLERYIRAFGFGELSGIELPGESRGILRPSERWAPLSQASISFGQEIGVTPLQMVTAANVVATSGYLMRPRLVLGFGENGGALDERLAPEPVRRVVDADTAARLTALLVGAVDRGTGRRAQIPGYRVAGKTGTAQKAVRGRYSKTDYIASFVGFAPAEAPAVTALVILDSPEGDHSGSRAAAVFARVVERALRYLQVPSAVEPELRVAQKWPQVESNLVHGEGSPRADAGFGRVSMRRWPPAPAPVPGDDVVVPDVVGLSARDALSHFLSVGIVPEILGSGWVVEQRPSPGEGLEPGSRARLFLGELGSDAESEPPAPRELTTARPLAVTAAENAGSPTRTLNVLAKRDETVY